MHCHNCEIALHWDGVSPVAVCGICRSYRSVDVPDDTGDWIVSLDRPGDFCCPCCRRRLVQAGMDGLKVEHCAGCDGVLLTDDVFAMFLRNRRPEFREAASQPVILVSEQRGNDIHCPNCRRVMNVHPCYGPDFLVIDACVGCGMVWLECRQAQENWHAWPSAAGVQSR